MSAIMALMRLGPALMTIWNALTLKRLRTGR